MYIYYSKYLFLLMIILQLNYLFFCPLYFLSIPLSLSSSLSITLLSFVIHLSLFPSFLSPYIKSLSLPIFLQLSLSPSLSFLSPCIIYVSSYLCPSLILSFLLSHITSTLNIASPSFLCFSVLPLKSFSKN